MTAAGSPPACWITATPLRSPHTVSCSRAAARKVSPAANNTDRFCACSHFASLPMDVVLPAPFTPVSMITNGRCGPTTSGCSSGSIRSTIAAARVERGSASAPARFQRTLRSSSRCCVASTPTSAPISAVSSSSSAVSSNTRRAKTLPNAPANFSRDRPRPALRRSVHDGLSGAAVSAGVFLNRSNIGYRPQEDQTPGK